MMTRRCILVPLVLMLLCASAYAQDVSKQNSRKSRLEKEIAILDKQIKDNAAKSANAINTLTLTREKIAARKELLSESERELAALQNDISVKSHQADSLQARLDTMNTYYGRLVRSAYKNRDSRIWYMYILSSENLAQGLRRYSYLKNLSKEMNAQAIRIREAKSLLEDSLDELEALRLEAQELRNQRQTEIDKLKEEEASSQKLVNSLSRDKKKIQKDMDAKKSEVQALNREIAKIIAEASKKPSSKSSSKKTTEVDYTLGKEFASNKGKLPWPAQGAVVERFGVQYHPVYTQLKLPNSDGISIAVSEGTQACAVFDGVVSKVIVMQGYNKCVLIQHGDYFSFYCKLGQVLVKAGDKVKTGQAVGIVEPLGGVSQLHFQIWSSKGPQDPMPWLRPR